MSQPNPDAACYLEYSGRECPVCHFEGVLPNGDPSRFDIENDVASDMAEFVSAAFADANCVRRNR
jgi:hypothetical protein